MFRKLLPRETSFFDFFEKHAAYMTESAHVLLSFGRLDQNPEEIFERIKSVEHEADVLAHQCIDALHKTFITPIERSDIHHLISKMDDVIDEIEDVAKFMVLYKLHPLEREAFRLAELVFMASNEVAAAIKELRKLKNTDVMKQRFINVHQFENEADTIFLHALERLFNEEKDPVQIIKWKEVYEHLEATTDACEDVANILEGILVEYE